MELFASDNLGCVCTHCNDWLFFLSNCLLRLCYFAANAIVASPPAFSRKNSQPCQTVVLSLIGSSQYIVALSLNILGADVNRCLWHLLLPNKIPNLDDKKLHLKGYLEGSSIYYVITDGGGLPKWLQYQMALEPQKVITQYMVDP